MKKSLKTNLLAISFAALCGFVPMDKAYAEVLQPATTALTLEQRTEINEQINAWNDIVNRDNKDWEGFANLSILYYERGDYGQAYSTGLKAQKLYEKYEYEQNDDLVRESMVKAGVSAYHAGKLKAAEKMLTDMLSYDLAGTKENKDAYNGMAYYYLAAIQKSEGNYDRSYTYINNAITFCPGDYIFLDFRNGFYFLDGFWHWRTSHHHHVHYRPSHHHHRPVPPRHHGPVIHRNERIRPPHRSTPDHPPMHRNDGPMPHHNPPMHRNEGPRPNNPPMHRNDGPKPSSLPSMHRNDGTKPSNPPMHRNEAPQRPTNPPMHRNDGPRPHNNPPAVQRNNPPQRPSNPPMQRNNGPRPGTQQPAPQHRPQQNNQQQTPQYQNGQQPAPQYRSPQSRPAQPSRTSSSSSSSHRKR